MQPFWIETPQRNLAIVPRPRGWDWLADDIAALKSAGIGAIISALTQDENEELGLNEEASVCRQNGIDYVSFPIEDRSVPRSQLEFDRFLVSIEALLDAGIRVGVHCRACVGRSSVIVASLLIRQGRAAEAALAAIGEARGCAVPDTHEQRLWITSLAVRGRDSA